MSLCGKPCAVVHEADAPLPTTLTPKVLREELQRFGNDTLKRQVSEVLLKDLQCFCTETLREELKNVGDRILQGFIQNHKQPSPDSTCCDLDQFSLRDLAAEDAHKDPPLMEVPAGLVLANGWDHGNGNMLSNGQEKHAEAEQAEVPWSFEIRRRYSTKQPNQIDQKESDQKGADVDLQEFDPAASWSSGIQSSEEGLYVARHPKRYIANHDNHEDNDPSRNSESSSRMSVQCACWLPIAAHKAVRWFVKSPYLDYASTVLIILNSIILGAQTDVAARDPFAGDVLFFIVTEKIFCVCFLTELLLRIYVYGFTFFYRGGMLWNWFDCFVVTTVGSGT